MSLETGVECRPEQGRQKDGNSCSGRTDEWTAVTGRSARFSFCCSECPVVSSSRTSIISWIVSQMLQELTFSWLNHTYNTLRTQRPTSLCVIISVLVLFRLLAPDIFTVICHFECSCLHSTNLNIKIHKTIILPVLYGWETWSLRLREEHRLRMFENRCWGGDLDLRRRKWREAAEGCIMRSFITCKLRQMLLGWSNQGGWDGRNM
jgi:hypothetical protein